MIGSPAKGYSASVEVPANSVFVKTHVESVFYQSVGSDLSVATHVFEGGSGDNGKRTFDTMLDYLDGLGSRSPFEWRWAPPDPIKSNRLWKHLRGAHASEWEPTGGKWRVVVTTYPQIAKMQLDAKNRSFEGDVKTIIGKIVTDNGLVGGKVEAGLPVELKRVIQSNQSDWEFVIGNLMFKLGNQPSGGVEMFTTNGDDLNLAGLAGESFEPHLSTVLRVCEHENSFDRVIMGGSTSTVVGFDHYQKTSVSESLTAPFMLQHTGTRTIYEPSRKNDALAAWASARVQRQGGRHRTISVTLTGIEPDEIALPCTVVLSGNCYRQKSISAVAVSALWTLKRKQLAVELTCRLV